MIGNTVKVDSFNRADIQRSVDEMTRRRSRLYEFVSNYPTEVEFAGYRLVLTKRLEVDQLIEVLTEKLARL